MSVLGVMWRCIIVELTIHSEAAPEQDPYQHICSHLAAEPSRNPVPTFCSSAAQSVIAKMRYEVSLTQSNARRSSAMSEAMIEDHCESSHSITAAFDGKMRYVSEQHRSRRKILARNFRKTSFSMLCIEPIFMKIRYFALSHSLPESVRV